ncbi:MAG: hypothetical protein WBA67_13750 [Jannaschia sp.]
MVRLPLAAAAAVSLTSSFPTTTLAQMQSCAPRDVVVSRLNKSYGENFSGGGLQGNSAVIEVWTSPEDGTWTILMTRSDGISCVMAAGTDWQPQLARHVVQGVPS